MTFHSYRFQRKLLAVFLFQLLLATAASAQYNIDALLKQAITDIQKENYTDAITKLNTCVEVQPFNCEALFYRGVCKYSLYDNVGAEQDLTSAMDKYSPIYYDAYRYRSQVRYRLSDFAGAIDDLNKAIEKTNDDPILYLARAFAKLASNDYKGALSDCIKSLKLKPMGEDVYLCKAAAEDALEKYVEAIADYDEALKFNATSKDVYVRRGNTRAKTEDYCEAIEDYNLALKADSSFTLAYFYRGEAESKLDSNKAALRDYNTVINYEPRNSYAYFNRATLYANMGKDKNAIEDFSKVLLLNPDNVEALSNRAKLRQHTKDFKGAIKDYDKIIELYPYFMEAYYERAQVKSEMNDVAGAQKDYDMGKMMSEVFHSKNSAQLHRDSVLLANLYHLDAGFNNVPKTTMDTINVHFQSFFYIDESSNENTHYSFSSFLNKINKEEKQSFHFTNTELVAFDTLAPQTGKSDLWTQVIQKTNHYLLTDAYVIINKVIEKDTLNALSYFQRGIITCREIELTTSIDEPSFFTNSAHPENEKKIKKERMSAIDDFTKAIRLQPTFSYAYFNRGNIKCALGDFNGALKDYETAIKTNPDFAEAYFNMGYILYHQNEKTSACGEFSKAGELGILAAYVFIKQYCSAIVK